MPLPIYDFQDSFNNGVWLKMKGTATLFLPNEVPLTGSFDTAGIFIEFGTCHLMKVIRQIDTINFTVVCNNSCGHLKKYITDRKS